MIKEKKLVPLLSILLVLVLCVIGYEVFYLINDYQVNQDVEYVVGTDTFEVNTPITINDFKIQATNGTIVNSGYHFDTSTIGEKSFTLETKNKKGTSKKYVVTYKVVDTTAPTITNDTNMTFYVDTELDFYSLLHVSDNYDENVRFTINGNIDITTAGTYNLAAILVDSSNNKATIPLTITLLDKPQANEGNYVLEDGVITTSKGYQIEIVDHIAYINGVMIVNKSYPLPSDYAYGFHEDTQAAFDLMKLDAAALGLNLYNSSGYRTYNYQDYLYNNYCNLYGQTYADTISARPGHSEHQSGYALDLNTIKGSFANTDEGIWVNDNCYKYGFILRYPKDKTNETGYAYEPWHLRYVGIELATALYNDGDWLTVEDYFGITSEYPY
ncbi:MAG: M15 family metallopeptidase [Erysipelotrichales bacterium]|nr:M15 family metallopeptidase [Erysipelotrichales bacterium]